MSHSFYLSVIAALNIHLNCCRYPISNIFHYKLYSIKWNWSLCITKCFDGISLFYCNTGHGIKDVGSKSLNHKANNVFRTYQAPITPSNTSTPLPPKSSEIPHSSSKTEKISNNNSNISKTISSSDLPSSQNADDTSELSGLYHLISFQDVVNSARKVNHLPTPSITASRRYEPHSRHRDLATMLAELAESSSLRSTSSASMRNRKISSTVNSAALQSVFLRKQGKLC